MGINGGDTIEEKLSAAEGFRDIGGGGGGGGCARNGAASCKW